MDGNVIVTADAAGNVIVRSAKNPLYGYIRVEQTRMVVDETGFARKRTLGALIPGSVDDLSGFGWEKDQEVKGKIIAKESLKPFNNKKPEFDYKIAGKSEVICSLGGAPIYRKHIYTLSEKAEDSVIEHDNGVEIQAAYSAMKDNAEAVTAEPKSDFEL